MRLTVLGGDGAWPAPGGACSGYLIEHDGFRLLIDPGYAVVPRLLQHVPAAGVDAVFVTHGHPDHCADLNPLLRARALGPDPAPPLPVYALPGSLAPVLALDRPGMLDDALLLREFIAGESLELGPIRAGTRALAHSRPNAGVRLSAGGASVAYTGDCGPGPDVVELARGAELFLAEATFADRVPDDSHGTLSSARDAGYEAVRAGVGRLVLTHLMPGTDRDAARAEASRSYGGDLDIARPGLVLEL